MEQVCIYEYLGEKNDPLFLELSNLKKFDKFVFVGMEIKRNMFDYYEVSCADSHVVFSSVGKVYNYLNDMLNKLY